MTELKELHYELELLSKDEMQALLKEAREENSDTFFGKHQLGAKILRFAITAMRIILVIAKVKPSWKIVGNIILEHLYGIAERNNIDVKIK